MSINSYCIFDDSLKATKVLALILDFVLIVGEGGKSAHLCDACGHKFKYVRNLRNHVRYECGKEAQFHCQFCSYKTKLKGNLKKHVTYLQVQTGTDCTPSLRVRETAPIPVSPLSTPGQTEGKPQETRVKETFRLLSERERREKPVTYETISLADGTRQYKCLYCQRSYKHNSTLWNHQRYECGKEPQFACPHCPYKAKLKGNLRKHLAMKHSGTFRQITQ
ncbi:hypothetical protein J6590_014728 [Homalodisca vitripennis]|nr:hypothetical protein J6590_014728 [Homalodisca vitripennis]